MSKKPLQIIVDVSELPLDEKKRINAALVQITGLYLCDPFSWGNVHILMAPSFNGASIGFSYGECASPTHTPAEVLEMAIQMQQAHPHAELMAQYAEDAKTTPKPWELWQIKRGSIDWISCTQNPGWDTSFEYRRKPKTHTVNGIEVPDLRFVPKESMAYYLPHPLSPHLYLSVFGAKPESQSHRISNNLCYEHTEAGKQAAILHAKAWLGIA